MFIVCYVMNILLLFCIGFEICDFLREVCDFFVILLMVNFLINFFVYVFFKNDIKKECKVFFCWKFKIGK